MGRKRTSQRYASSSSGSSKFFDEKGKYMWTFVFQRRILCERVIHQGDHEKVGIYQLFSDKKTTRYCDYG